ncbi:adenosine deaminase [Staphylococcus edaphicus]|uniref:adenosine deaminase n=1 Tax=Staphylococcus edaphicus TaxID=1955013 RepID=A0A2C6U3N4_9STAP|nr:adenosine deaminase [Staphylococcus edaphicus]PHK48492.1 adenosine deaminase [Staphylococcus edaphicus]UQW81491.1 adenosine deaminase [Staphylococcus edaphicus]
MNKSIEAIAKVELHCHLDGSTSVELIRQLADEQGINLDESKLFVSSQCDSLDDYLQCFDEILKVLQTKDSLKRAVVDVAKQACKDNVKYIEVRFAPLFHMHQGLTLTEVLEAVEIGVKEAVNTLDIDVNILICAMRQHSAEQNQALFDFIHKHDHEAICGIDFAGPEVGFPTEHIEDTIRYGLDKGFNLTLHAGECGCIHNVIEGIKLGSRRIGHGVAINQDKQLLQFVKDNDILLEICPKSNIQTKAITNLEDLNLPYLLELDTPILINTDNRTVTQTSLIEEYELLVHHHLITLEQIAYINKKAVNYTFLTEAEKRALLLKM